MQTDQTYTEVIFIINSIPWNTAYCDINDLCFRPRFCTIRLCWAGDNLGWWDGFCYGSCPRCRIDHLSCWPVQHATTVLRSTVISILDLSQFGYIDDSVQAIEEYVHKLNIQCSPHTNSWYIKYTLVHFDYSDTLISQYSQSSKQLLNKLWVNCTAFSNIPLEFCCLSNFSKPYVII